MTTAAIRNFERTRFVTFDAVVPIRGAGSVERDLSRLGRR